MQIHNMGGCQNCGPFLGVPVKGDIDIDVDIDIYRFIKWVVVRIMVPFWVLSITRHLLLGDPKGDHNFENHPSWFWLMAHRVNIVKVNKCWACKWDNCST